MTFRCTPRDWVRTDAWHSATNTLWKLLNETKVDISQKEGDKGDRKAKLTARVLPNGNEDASNDGASGSKDETLTEAQGLHTREITQLDEMYSTFVCKDRFTLSI